MKRPAMTKRSEAVTWVGGGLAWIVAGLVREGSEEWIWILADLLLLVGLLGLWSHRHTIGARAASIGLGLALAGRVAFIAAEILAAAQGTDDNPLLPLGALLTAIGMTTYGVTVLHTHRGDGPGRFAPLVMGLYPFVVMFPYVAAHGGDASVAAITWWGLPAIAIGLARRPDSRHHDHRHHGGVTMSESAALRREVPRSDAARSTSAPGSSKGRWRDNVARLAIVMGPWWSGRWSGASGLPLTPGSERPPMRAGGGEAHGGGHLMPTIGGRP